MPYGLIGTMDNKTRLIRLDDGDALADSMATTLATVDPAGNVTLDYKELSENEVSGARIDGDAIVIDMDVDPIVSNIAEATTDHEAVRSFQNYVARVIEENPDFAKGDGHEYENRIPAEQFVESRVAMKGDTNRFAVAPDGYNKALMHIESIEDGVARGQKVANIYRDGSVSEVEPVNFQVKEDKVELLNRGFKTQTALNSLAKNADKVLGDVTPQYKMTYLNSKGEEKEFALKSNSVKDADSAKEFAENLVEKWSQGKGNVQLVDVQLSPVGDLPIADGKLVEPNGAEVVFENEVTRPEPAPEAPKFTMTYRNSKGKESTFELNNKSVVDLESAQEAADKLVKSWSQDGKYNIELLDVQNSEDVVKAEPVAEDAGLTAADFEGLEPDGLEQ